MLNGKKTYSVVLGGLAVVAGLYFQGQLDLSEAVIRIIELLGIGTLRHGIATK